MISQYPFLDKGCGGDTPSASTLASDVSRSAPSWAVDVEAAGVGADCLIPSFELWTVSLISRLLFLAMTLISPLVLSLSLTCCTALLRACELNHLLQVNPFSVCV